MTSGNPQVDTIRRLGEVSRDYEKRASAYETVRVDAAKAEAEYRRIHAEAMLRAMAEGSSAAKSEAIANADAVVADSCWKYKVTDAVADAARAKLSQLRSQLEYGRTVVASERAADQIHASGTGGAA